MNIIRPAPNITYTIVGPTIVIVEKDFCPIFINPNMDVRKYIYGIGLHQPEHDHNFSTFCYKISKPGPYLFIGGSYLRVIVSNSLYGHASHIVWSGV